MRITISTLLFSVIGLSILQASPQSFADKGDELFFQVSGNMLMADSTDMSSTSNQGSNSWDPGYGVNIAVGQYILAGAYVSLEYSYRIMGVDTSTITSDDVTGPTTTTSNSGNIMMNSAMVNLVYEMPLINQFFWYIGGGIGGSWVRANHGMKDFGIAWQAMAGLGLTLTEQITIIGGYRLFTTHDIKDKTDGGADFQYETPYVHNFEVGVRYNF
jgi:opacity protein-like surface antigen